MKVVLVVALFTSACSSNPAPVPAAAAPAPSAEASSEPTAAEETPPAPTASAAPLKGCPAHLAEFDETLATATSECSHDADCMCFADGLAHARGSECGGVVDAKTGKKLAAIQRKAKKDNCSNGSMCEPWTCAPVCEGGRCQKGARKK